METNTEVMATQNGEFLDISHINMNVRDLGRFQAFYELSEFKIADPTQNIAVSAGSSIT